MPRGEGGPRQGGYGGGRFNNGGPRGGFGGQGGIARVKLIYFKTQSI